MPLQFFAVTGMLESRAQAATGSARGTGTTVSDTGCVSARQPVPVPVGLPVPVVRPAAPARGHWHWQGRGRRPQAGGGPATRMAARAAGICTYKDSERALLVVVLGAA